MNENNFRKEFDVPGDKLFTTLYRDEGVFIFLNREGHDPIHTHMAVNNSGFSFDISKKDFLRLTRAMNYAIRALKIERLEDYR